MGEAISNLLGNKESDLMTKTLRDNLSRAFGRDVKVAETVKNGYRNEGGRVFLRDIDSDEIKQKW